jgi:SAM-dependent methyltransferase
VATRLPEARQGRHDALVTKREPSGKLSCAVIAALALGCSYPAPPAAWSQIDRDRPARQPDVPYEPSSLQAIAAMIELGQPGPADVVYDLGCGDGRVVIEAVRRSGARGVGVDLDPKLIRLAGANAVRARVSERVSFRTEDLFATDLREATVVMLFLWPEINLRLLPKLLRELRPGARIVSNWHDMGSFEPTRAITLAGEGKSHSVYLWVVGAQKK